MRLCVLLKKRASKQSQLMQDYPQLSESEKSVMMDGWMKWIFEKWNGKQSPQDSPLYTIP